MKGADHNTGEEQLYHDDAGYLHKIERGWERFYSDDQERVGLYWWRLRMLI